MSNFDPETFLDSVVTDSFQKRPPLPPGDYMGVIGEIKQPQSGQKKKDPSQTWFALNIPIEIDTSQKPGVREHVGQDKVIVFDFVGLDLTEEGKLDTGKGKNRQLSRYREAIGAAEKGFAPRMLAGRTVLVKIVAGEYQGEPREEVGGVARVA